MEKVASSFISCEAAAVLLWGFQNRLQLERNHTQNVLAAVVKDERVVREPAGNLKCWTSWTTHTDFFVNAKSRTKRGKKCE